MDGKKRRQRRTSGASGAKNIGYPEFVASLCAETGIRWSDALDLTKSQAELLWQACLRRRAESTLMQSRGVFLAAAAMMSKDGFTKYRKFEKELMAAAEEGLVDRQAVAKQTRKSLYRMALAIGAKAA